LDAVSILRYFSLIRSRLKYGMLGKLPVFKYFAERRRIITVWQAACECLEKTIRGDPCASSRQNLATKRMDRERRKQNDGDS
jgi:hypothetical protein